ncbi:DUF4382 domain-containing protein [Pantanalinema rosaneae CENA516]|uniref:DUF4382 domain-containing protein n=1 Tax=Pantanalinema rosaneae TaxID=1620701 RepID=UPI003D6FDAF7
MKKFCWLVGSVLAIALQSCTNTSSPPSQTNTSSAPSQTTTTNPAASEGTLQIRANGEDFVRQGFTSKDGWQISFDHVYVTMADVTAYQTDPPYDAQTGGDLKATQQVSLGQPQTVDLAAGDETAEPILVGETKAPAGRYNALSWKMPKATEGEANGYALKLVGTATKAGTTLPFTIRVDQELGFQCGEFVGDDRKGTLTAGNTADLEATFHFDHLFGDAGSPMTDDLNQQALGFDPLAKLATGGKVDVNTAALKQGLSTEDFQKFQGILPSLGHVGEGHCQETTLAQR